MQFGLGKLLLVTALGSVVLQCVREQKRWCYVSCISDFYVYVYVCVTAHTTCRRVYLCAMHGAANTLNQLLRRDPLIKFYNGGTSSQLWHVNHRRDRRKRNNREKANSLSKVQLERLEEATEQGAGYE